MPAAMSEPLFGIVGIDQSETTRGTRGIKVLRLAPERGGEKRGNKTVKNLRIE